MIKKFKQYNKEEDVIYNVGDYITVIDKVHRNYNKIGIVKYARINIRAEHSDESQGWYQNYQLKKATPKEIEKYEIEQNINKYNL